MFKIGDRVKVVKGAQMYKVGNMEGVIVVHDKYEHTTWYGIDFGKNVAGHDCSHDTITYGHGWFVEGCDLELVSTKETKIQKVTEYEYQPYNITVIEKEHGEVISVSNIQEELFTAKVIRNNQVTIVILPDGSKGIAKCNPSDKYDENLGLSIAWKRAFINQLQEEIKLFTK